MHTVRHLGTYLLVRTQLTAITRPYVVRPFGAGFYRVEGYCLPMFSGFLRIGNVLWSFYPCARVQS